ncbi:recombinase family protein [Chitinophaga varians]|uniref:Recombinase family protein n=1 Tax=Chitinophaga varians TaxID=2202339 RepID=A0A847RNT0_9BACT|nr:recombinase family protein [Chitinophaga varians]NLR64763.1 recombinase family protein [Chitinophaga varians]
MNLKKKNAILYTRVSTDDQAQHGYSLIHQYDKLKSHCNDNGISIIKHFKEDYSAKNFNRPEWKNLMQYIKANKGVVNTILFTKWDRFTRSLEETFTVISTLRKMGISVNAIEQEIDFSIPESKLMLSVYVAGGDIERDKICQRTKDGMRAMRKQGKWNGTAPLGYKYHREDSRSSWLVIDPVKASFITDAFSLYSTGIYSIPEVQRLVSEKHNYGVKRSKQAFINILRNQVYIGNIKLEATDKEDEIYIKGIHTPLVDEHIFQRVQDILDNRKRSKNIRYQDQRHPLRGFLKCPQCSKNMTSSAVKKKKFVYYQCQEGHRRYPALFANEQFENLLTKTFNIDENIITCYQKILEDTFDRNGSNIKNQLKGINKQIVDYEQKRSNKEDDYINERIPADVYNSARKRLDGYINELINQKTTLEGNMKHQFKNYLVNTSILLRNLSGVYKKSDVEIKRRILGVILEDKLIFENNTYQTPTYTPAVDLLLRTSKGLKEKRKGSEENSEPLSSSAPPAGLEPAPL